MKMVTTDGKSAGSCPICKDGTVMESEKSFLGIVSSKKMLCDKCGTRFYDRGDNSFKLDMPEAPKDSALMRFDQQVLSLKDLKSILRTNMTVRENIIANMEKGNLPVVNNPPVMLKPNEIAHLMDPSKLREPRSVRNYGGVSFRAIGTSRIYMGQGESHLEEREIDSGTLVLTNMRLLFLGTNRTLNIDLKRIINVTTYDNGFQISRDNKNKPETFIVDNMDFWCATLKSVLS